MIRGLNMYPQKQRMLILVNEIIISFDLDILNLSASRSARER
jgi:hypothetical protein